MSYGTLELSDVVDSMLSSVRVKEAANVTEWPVSVTDSGTDAPVFLPFAAETMLQELEKVPSESMLLTDLFRKLSHDSAVHRYCSISSPDTVTEFIDDNTCLCEFEHSACDKKRGPSHLHGARSRIAKLEENSRDIVSMFIPLDAPKLSFFKDSGGVFYA